MVSDRLSKAHLYWARQSLVETQRRYLEPPSEDPQTQQLWHDCQQQLDQLVTKLDQQRVRVVLLGGVSRGKSALINALLGREVMTSSPLHGVTRFPQGVVWTQTAGDALVEFVDTPGLGEADGKPQAAAAWEIVQTADLVLFVGAGEITEEEARALERLQGLSKPFILVFNKADLYPDPELPASLAAYPRVVVAAAPQARQVRLEWPDGRVEYRWETPPPQVEELRQLLVTLLNQQGRSWVALNTLTQAAAVEADLAVLVVAKPALGWGLGKVLGVLLLPLAGLDLLLGAAMDLGLVRHLGLQYQVPIHSYRPDRLVWALLLSGVGLGLSELGDLWLPEWWGAWLQSLVAGGGSLWVGRTAQTYWQEGRGWGPYGIRRAIAAIERSLGEIEVKDSE